MAYTTINKSTDNFKTKLYSGNGTTNHNITGVGFQPDLVWTKGRSGSYGVSNHKLADSVRGAGQIIHSNLTDSQYDQSGSSGATIGFTSDGFTLGTNSNSNNGSTEYASWNWKAGGTAPSQTYVVKVVSDSGNKYRFDDFGTSAVTLDLQEGGTYTFDQADSSNAGHPLRFYTASDKSGGEYTTGVTTNGTPGSSGAYTRITVASGAPTLYYQCSSHAGMGGQANTNSTFGSSNFGGSIQSTVSANTIAGFSIVKFTANGSNSDGIGHGLGVAPKIVLYKRIDSTGPWYWAYKPTTSSLAYLILNDTDAKADLTLGTYGFSTSTTFTNLGLGNTHNMIAYCFAEKTGYSKIGSYSANGNADGTFVYTGFAPKFIIFKRTDASGYNWVMMDDKRNTYNPWTNLLLPNETNAEIGLPTNLSTDFLSNGFKLRSASGANPSTNQGTIIYMAFGQTIVGSNNVPATAR